MVPGADTVSIDSFLYFLKNYFGSRILQKLLFKSIFIMSTQLFIQLLNWVLESV